jgi:hypothetical protein
MAAKLARTPTRREPAQIATPPPVSAARRTCRHGSTLALFAALCHARSSYHGLDTMKGWLW